MNGKVVAICISPFSGNPMQSITDVEALEGAGLKGDRYATGVGSFNKSNIGVRQVTLLNEKFLEESGFKFSETRRNILTRDVELMWLIGREFIIGDAVFRGVKYCDPCSRPSNLSNNPKKFSEVFSDCGGLIAEIIQGGVIRVGDDIIPPPKGY